MTNKQFIKKLGAVTDPYEALRLIFYNECLFGFDPYYRDLRVALLDMAKRVGWSEEGGKQCRST